MAITGQWWNRTRCLQAVARDGVASTINEDSAGRVVLEHCVIGTSSRRVLDYLLTKVTTTVATFLFPAVDF